MSTTCAGSVVRGRPRGALGALLFIFVPDGIFFVDKPAGWSYIGIVPHGT